jgi:hypothetical protein
VSASLGVDTQDLSNRVGVMNTGIVASAPSVLGVYTNAYAAPTAPDVVGNIKLDQAWGLLQFSAAAHEVTGDYYTTTATVGHPSDKWGFAVSGALQIKNLPTGPGDDIKITGTYTEGALRYVLGESGTTPANFATLNGGSTFAAVPIADGVYGGVGSSIQLTKAYGMNGAFNHNWSPNWASSVFGSYSHVDYNGTATAAICATAYGVRGAGGVCNPDFNVSQLGLSTTWTPVKNLAFIAEGTWAHIDQNNTGTVALTGLAARTATYGDTDMYSGVLRVQRSF